MKVGFELWLREGLDVTQLFNIILVLKTKNMVYSAQGLKIGPVFKKIVG